MARRKQDYRLKRTISIRLQRIIEERYGNFYDFVMAMRAQGRTALASTVRGWLPPQKAWRAKPDGGAVRRTDWEAVKIPDSSGLVEFCEVLSVRADYILLGDGVASRSQSRTHQELKQDIAAYLAEALTAGGFTKWSASDVDAESVLGEAVAACRQEATLYQQKMAMLPGRQIAHLGGTLDQVWELGRYLPETPEAMAQLFTLATATALLETSIAPESGSSDSPTRYLRAPKFSVHDIALPKGAIDERISLSLQRFATETPMQLDQLTTKNAHFKTMLALFCTTRVDSR